MALVLSTPECDGRGIALSYLGETSQATPQGGHDSTEVPGLDLRFEAVTLQDLSAKQSGAAPWFPETQHPLLPEAHRCRVALPLSAPGGADQAHSGQSKSPGRETGSDSGHPAPSLALRTPRHLSSLQPTLSRAQSPRLPPPCLLTIHLPSFPH